MRNMIPSQVARVPPSDIRRFFDIAATMKDVISLGIGEPDFVTPLRILRAGMNSLRRGETHYTPNAGTIELLLKFVTIFPLRSAHKWMYNLAITCPPDSFTRGD